MACHISRRTAFNRPGLRRTSQAIPDAARCTSTPKVLIAAHPTRGVDVGAQAQIWDSIREARRAGMGVLLISADLDELIGLSDSLKVMYRGKLVADADPATVTPEQLGLAMTGAAA